ncbi:hypothetical protein [Zavarzinia sp. CC-PAN008]|uniref:hypothetical protein n=1 Tax=Zavarzinia sp. CC-PAN008 TaxID=3243332 RepID=UPI003F743469
MMRFRTRATRHLTLALVLAALLAPPLPALASAKGDGGSFDMTTGVLAFPYLSVSVIRDGRPRGLLTIGLGLELEAAEEAPHIQHLTPKLQDAYMMAATRFAQELTNLRAPIDVAALTATLQTATDKQLGPGKAKVLITYAQMMRR